MTVTLPIATRRRALHRVLWRSYSYPAGDAVGGWSAWMPLPMSQRFGSKTWSRGYRVKMYRRGCLPIVGDAVLIWDEGTINGRAEPVIDSLTRLKGAEIRIQASPAPAFGAEAGFRPTWRTSWWGTVEHQVHDITGGAYTFFAYDGLFRAKQQRMTSHSAQVNDALFDNCPGHPGYNFALQGWYARVLGNRDFNNATFDRWKDVPAARQKDVRFTFPGAGGTYTASWNDQQAVESALAIARGPGDPIWEVRGSTDLLSGVSAWPVYEGMDAWTFVAKVCDRRRGRGVVFPDWEDDVADPNGPLDTCLRVRAATVQDLAYTPPGSAASVLQGATTRGTARAVDLVDDQRLVPGSLQIADRSQYRFDYVESFGEPIEALITLAYTDGNLAPRWTAADATAFAALTNPRHRATARWDPVYQRHGTPYNWRFVVKDGNAGATFPQHRIDIACDDHGFMVTPNITDTAGGASPLTLRLLSDLPLYEGYDYSTGVVGGVRYDGATDTLCPPRRQPLILTRSSGDRYLDLSRMGYQLQIDPMWGFYVRYGADQDEAVSGRLLSEPGVPGFGIRYDTLITTVGVQFGNRMRMATGNPLGRRRLPIYHSGLHLWVASPGAIWDLDRALTVQAEAPAKRGAGAIGLTEEALRPVYRLRDDRTSLSFLHALSCVWYLQDHRPFRYQLNDCMFLPSYVDAVAGDVQFPKLGEVATTIDARDRNGDVLTSTTGVPITSIIYDVENDRSGVVGDWAELDFTQ